jgi:hypothetical protein
MHQNTKLPKLIGTEALPAGRSFNRVLELRTVQLAYKYLSGRMKRSDILAKMHDLTNGYSLETSYYYTTLRNSAQPRKTAENFFLN